MTQRRFKERARWLLRGGGRTRETLGFIVHSPVMFDHYGAIWKHLDPGSFELVLEGTEGERRESAALARQWDIPFATMDELRRQRYRYLVSNHGKFSLVRRSIHNIRMMYSLGKEAWNLSRWNDLYDVILVYGPHQAAALEQFAARKIQIGYPRYDRFFNGEIDRERLGRKLGIDPRRRTVVWLPTWGEASTAGLFAAAIGALANRYNVVVKPHPLTPVHEPERMEQLRRQPYTALITDHLDSVELYAIADFMLCDYGGPAFGCIYTDRNLLLLNSAAAPDSPMVGPWSLELELRRAMPNVDLEQADRIPELLEDDAIWAAQRQQYEALRQRLFAPYRGNSGEVAARTLRDIAPIIAVHRGQRRRLPS